MDLGSGRPRSQTGETMCHMCGDRSMGQVMVRPWLGGLGALLAPRVAKRCRRPIVVSRVPRLRQRQIFLEYPDMRRLRRQEMSERKEVALHEKTSASKTILSSCTCASVREFFRGLLQCCRKLLGPFSQKSDFFSQKKCLPFRAWKPKADFVAKDYLDVAGFFVNGL